MGAAWSQLPPPLTYCFSISLVYIPQAIYFTPATCYRLLFSLMIEGLLGRGWLYKRLPSLRGTARKVVRAAPLPWRIAGGVLCLRRLHLLPFWMSRLLIPEKPCHSFMNITICVHGFSTYNWRCALPFSLRVLRATTLQTCCRTWWTGGVTVPTTSDMTLRVGGAWPLALDITSSYRHGSKHIVTSPHYRQHAHALAATSYYRWFDCRSDWKNHYSIWTGQDWGLEFSILLFSSLLMTFSYLHLVPLQTIYKDDICRPLLCLGLYVARSLPLPPF